AFSKSPGSFPAAFERGHVQYPSPQNLISAIHGIEAPPALVAIFLAALHVERLAQNLAVLDVLLVHAFEERDIVGMRRSRTEVPAVIGGLERHRWHAAGHGVATETGE